jgi:hypothetical protein
VGVAVEQDQGANPLGMSDREMDRPTAPGRLSCHRRSLETGVVEHSEEVGVEDRSI